jgi:hypothetical protein
MLLLRMLLAPMLLQNKQWTALILNQDKMELMTLVRAHLEIGKRLPYGLSEREDIGLRCIHTSSELRNLVIPGSDAAYAKRRRDATSTPKGASIGGE